jgi:hypothetical protein
MAPRNEPVAAADVDQPAQPAEVVGGDHMPGLVLGRPVIAPWNTASCSGCWLRYPKNRSPYTCSNAVPPSRTAASIPAAAR